MRQSRRLSSPSAIASCEESTQVATSPCCQRDLLDVILRIFPWLPGPLPRRSHRVHAPVDFPDVIGLPPRKDGLASRFIPRTRLSVGEFSRLQTFRYVQAPKFVCLPDRSHRYGNAIGRPRLLHPGRTCFVASARTGYASRPKQAIDGARTCTLLDPQHCRPLPLPPNTLTSSYYFRHSNQHAQIKPDSLGHRFSGTAFGWSSFLTFVSRRSLALRSAPSVNPACAALRGAYPKTAPCSLPRPWAPLRSGD